MSYKGYYISVVVAAAGMGKRMKQDMNKQYILLKDKPVLVHTVEHFQQLPQVDEIVIVTKEDEIGFCREHIVEAYKLSKVKRVIPGGKERQDSVYMGLKGVNKRTDIVLIHDGARPFINHKIIIDGIQGAIDHRACTIGVPVKDTIKQVNANQEIASTPDRSTLWAVQTPQCFDYNLIMKAHKVAGEKGIKATDDSMLVEDLGQSVRMVMGSYKNIKLTTPEDLLFGEAILRNHK